MLLAIVDAFANTFHLQGLSFSAFFTRALAVARALILTLPGFSAAVTLTVTLASFTALAVLATVSTAAAAFADARLLVYCALAALSARAVAVT